MTPFVISKRQRILQVVLLLAALTAVAEWRAFTPDANNAREVYQVENNPIAVALGTAFPAVILAPFAYWFYGWCAATRDKRRLLAEAKRSESTPESPHKESRAALDFGVNTSAEVKQFAPMSADTNARPESDLDDEQNWAAAIKEFDSDSRRHGLYAKLYANFDGDESKIKAAYLKTRVAEMTREAQQQSERAREREAQASAVQARYALAFQEAAAMRTNYRAT